MVQLEGNRCPLCGKKGILSELIAYQISLEDAIYMCCNSECLYPLGHADSAHQSIFKRKASDAAFRLKKSRSHSNSSSPALTPSNTPLTSPRLTPRTTSPELQTFAEFNLRSPPPISRTVCDGTLLQNAYSNTSKPVLSSLNGGLGIKPLIASSRNPLEKPLKSTTSVVAVTGSQFSPLELNHGGDSSFDTLNSECIGTSELPMDEEVKSGLFETPAFPQQNCAHEQLVSNNIKQEFGAKNILCSDIGQGYDEISSHGTGDVDYETLNLFAQSPLVTTQTDVSIATTSGLNDLVNSVQRQNNSSIETPKKRQTQVLGNDIHFSRNSLQRPVSKEHDVVNSLENSRVCLPINSAAGNGNNGQDALSIPQFSVDSALKIQDSTNNTQSLSNIQTSVSKLKRSPGETRPQTQIVNKDFSNCFLQWKNRDALCWLDVTLIFLVYCSSLKRLLALDKFSTTLLKELVSCYEKARDINCQSLEFKHCANLARQGRIMSILTSIGKITVKTGGGCSPLNDNSASCLANGESPNVLVSCVKRDATQSASVQRSPVKVGQHEWLMTPDELEDRAAALVCRAESIMEQIREKVWQELYPKMRCDKGSNDSPVFALPLLLKERPEFVEHFRLQYEWHLTCTECGYRHVDVQQKTLPSFPRVEKDFNMAAPYFRRACFRCYSPGQRMTLTYKQLGPGIIAHFVDGLHQSDLRDYDFAVGGDRYIVKAIVQYVNSPDHFIGWVRRKHYDRVGSAVSPG